MTSPRPAPSAASDAATTQAPAPRRTRDGAVIIGPTLWARARDGLLIGLPLISLVLCTFPGAALQQWRRAQIRAGHDGWLVDLLAPAWMQLLLGFLLLWLLLGAWGVLALAFTRRVVLLEEGTGALQLLAGPRVRGRAHLRDVVFAIGEPAPGGMGLIGLRLDGDRDPAAGESGPSLPRPMLQSGDPEQSVGEELRRWSLPSVGWDDASFDGLRVLQAAAGLLPAPPRGILLEDERRARRMEVNRELASRLGMPWRDQYARDESAFQAEFDRVRRVLGGLEPPRDGDPEP